MMMPKWKVGASVVAFDASARAQGINPWRSAVVGEILREDGAWWVRVVFEGGRSSILKPDGVREEKNEGS